MDQFYPTLHYQCLLITSQPQFRCSFFKVPLNTNNQLRIHVNSRTKLYSDGSVGSQSTSSDGRQGQFLLGEGHMPRQCTLPNATKELLHGVRIKAMLLKLRKLDKFWMKSNLHFLQI
ncbi:hypothetical protein Tco_0471584 [Tanacetum coccineum]